jgi:trimeric autotransporter adhesin
MTYVGASARWSVTGSGTVLTDLNNTDSQTGTASQSIIYDFGVTQALRATAVINTVPAGATGTLTFQVNVNTGLASGANPATALTAAFSYNDGSSTVSAVSTNTVQYTVQSSASLTVSSSTVASATQGSTVVFTNTVTNTGNGSDNINLTLSGSTFPAGTTFQLFRPDAVTPLLDSNGDGIPDTGPIAGTNGTLAVVVKAILPPVSTGGPFTVTVNAKSTTDATKTATGTDTLTVITANTVDLTLNTAGGPGVGAGPEGTAVAPNTGTPGWSVRSLWWSRTRARLLILTT